MQPWERYKKMPVYEMANSLYENRDQFSERWVIEALALAELPPKEICKYVSVKAPKVIDIYCKCFFACGIFM